METLLGLLCSFLVFCPHPASPADRWVVPSLLLPDGRIDGVSDFDNCKRFFYRVDNAALVEALFHRTVSSALGQQLSDCNTTF